MLFRIVINARKIDIYLYFLTRIEFEFALCILLKMKASYVYNFI